MEYRFLGSSGLRISELSFGTATFGGSNEFFKKWGSTGVQEATRMVNLCLDAGINLFDTADVYSQGMAEEILGKAIAGHRDKLLISTKATFQFDDGANSFGSSRQHLIQSVENSLKRLNTDHIDIYYMHGFDANTPVEETLYTLNTLVESGKVRYIGASNFSGWHLMKSLAASEKNGWPRYIAHQAYYSLINREYEWELMPLALDQKIGTVVWSPLAGGKLGGKLRRGQPASPNTRIGQGGGLGPEIPQEKFYTITDALEAIAGETGKTMAQVALNRLLQRPSVASLIIGARNEEQLKQNIAATGWNLTAEQIKKLDAASETDPIYPYWHQREHPELNSTLKF